MNNNFVNIGTLFDDYPVNFPVNDGDKLKIIVGANGSGKTLTLLLLKDWFESLGENVIYFSDFRKLTCNFDDAISAQMASILITDNDPFDKIDMDSLKYSFELYKGQYINSGILQLTNFLGSIMKSGKDSIVIIDFPETNLDIFIQKKFLSTILSCCNLKKLIVATHSPEIISNHLNNVIDIRECVKL